MFPMIAGALAIVGLAIRNPGTEANFQALMLQAFPASAQPELLNALHGLKDSAGWLGLASFAGLLWSASSIFATMEFALTGIFGTRQRDLLRQRAMGLIMMAVLIVAIAAVVAANSMAALVPIPLLATIASVVVGSAVMVLLLLALYRLVPNRTYPARDILPGALLAGICIEVLSLAFPLYERVARGFNTYGAQFALFFLLATWFYLLSQLILFGAVYNRIRLGEPRVHGLLASPMSESRERPQSVDAIKQQRSEADPGDRP
jgi:membrane protein